MRAPRRLTGVPARCALQAASAPAGTVSVKTR